MASESMRPGAQTEPAATWSLVTAGTSTCWTTAPVAESTSTSDDFPPARPTEKYTLPSGPTTAPETPVACITATAPVTMPGGGVTELLGCGDPVGVTLPLS